MKNWEKYFDGIVDFIVNQCGINNETGKVMICDLMNCDKCDYRKVCHSADGKRKWLLAEVEEKSVQMTQDERNILIAMYHKGYRYIARDYLILSNRTEPTYSIAVFTFEPENSFCEQAQLTDSGRRNYYWTTGENIDNKGCRLYAFEDWFQFVRPQKPELIMDLINRAVVRENRTGEVIAKSATSAKNAPVEGELR